MMPQNPYGNFNAQSYVEDATKQAKQRASSTGSQVGSATGAIIGSIIPGLGTVIGAGIGSVLGSGIGYLAGGGKAREQAQNEANQMLAYGQEQVREGIDNMFEGQFETAQQQRLLSMRRNVAPQPINYLNFM